jgi:two-component system nitrogen regulation sensor histidine kinase GlnL
VRHLTDTLATGESRSESSAVIEGPDGRPVHVSLLAAPLAGRSGAVTSAVAVVRDISRLRQLESEVRRGETLAAAGQMAVGLAHEIPTRLRHPRRRAAMQRELRRGARVIHGGASQGGNLGHRSSKCCLTRAPVTLRCRSVHQLLERVALLLEEEATSLGVQFVRRYDPSLPPILADEDRIVQVFHNLVRNAIEAMPGGGRLTLVTRLSMNPLFAKVDLGQGQKSLAEIQIADEGQGIPEATRDRLFTPFFTTKDRGLGLGLALCHRIVEEHKGRSGGERLGRHAVSCFLLIAR